jgi:hypothetical protein
MQWLAVLLVGRLVEQGPPLLAAQRWWTNRGPHTSFKRDEEGKRLVELAASWGREVIHIFDQGFASAFWLGLLLAYSLRFVLRWRKDYQLLDAAGKRRLTWKIAQGKRGWSQRWVWDARRARWIMATVLVLPVAHPFLLSLLNEGMELLRFWLLRYYCHRTGRQCRDARFPLTRLRCALSRLWQDHPPNFSMVGASRTPIHVSEVR